MLFSKRLVLLLASVLHLLRDTSQGIAGFGAARQLLEYGLMAIFHHRFIPTFYLLVALAVFLLGGNVLAQADKLSPSLLQTNMTEGKVKVVAFLNPATQQAFRMSVAAVGPVRTKSAMRCWSRNFSRSVSGRRHLMCS